MKNIIIFLFLFHQGAAFSQWYKVADVTGECLEDIAFADSLYGVVVGNDVFLTTYDGGETWIQDSSKTGGFQVAKFTSENTGFVCCSPDPDGIMLYTYDKGETWLVNENFFPLLSLTLDFLNGSEAVVIYKSGILIRSIRSIENFELGGYDQIITFGTPWDVQFINSDTGFVCGELLSEFHSSVYKTVDGGETWYTNEHMYGPMFDLHFPSANVGYGIGLEKQIWKTENGGENWFILGTEFKDYPGKVYFSSENIGLISLPMVYKTIDGGETWYPTDYPSTEEYVEEFYCINDSTCYAITCSSIYKTTNGGGISTLHNLNPNFTFTLTPNPATTILQLQLSLKENNYTIQTFNLVGELIPLMFQNNQADISQLPPGIYFTEVITEQGRAVQKWVKM